MTVTKHEMLTSLNKSHAFIFALVEFPGSGTQRLYCLLRRVQREPDFGVTSVNHGLAELMARAEGPR
jgi:hypothetical protein